MDDERRIAFNVLMDVEEKKAYSHLALNYHVARAKPETRAIARRLSYGVLENKIYLDYLIDHYLEEGKKDIGLVERNILRLGIYQIRSMDTIPDYAAVSETVNLAKRYKKGMEGFINAILRNYLRSGDEIQLPNRDEDEALYLSVKYSYSKWMVEMWIRDYGVAFTEELLAAGNKTPDLNVRPNLLKVSRKEMKRRLEQRDYTVEEARLSKLALRIKELASGEVLTQTDSYKEGLISIQDESSMLAVEVLDPRAEDFVVDVCAAPGGKTLYMAELMANKGRILARDLYRKKLDRVDQEKERLGVKIVETETWDAQSVDTTLLKKADRVLADVPCSGLGTVRRKPEIKYKEEEEFKTLPEVQKSILSYASKYVKTGGTLVYSTCTINKEENQEVIKEFLLFNDDFIKLEEIQLMPNINDTDGFYICKMQRR